MEMMNQVEYAQLNDIKARIEIMDKKHHIEILRILKRYADVKLNENKSGVFVNMSFLTADAVSELRQYVEYIEAQESALLSAEAQKATYQNTFFNKQDKEEGAVI